MQVCTVLQTDSHASIPPLSFLTGRMPFLPPNQQRQSTEVIPPVKNWTMLLVQSFTAHMPLLTATTAFGLGRRCWSCQQCYLHSLHTLPWEHVEMSEN